ncbi:MAG: hypothetical protein HUU37_00800 [Bdellovibrionales bacterium]|nr:hypothetical protein [Bdellovibrionales bacterium]
MHVFKDQKFIAKVELDAACTVMEGKVNRKIRQLIKNLAH